MRPSLQRFVPLSFFLAVLAVPATSSALTSAESSCRDNIAKTISAYTAYANKVMLKCHQQRSAGSRPLSTDCNDPNQADTSGTVASLRENAVTSILSACSGATSLLSQYSACPAPAASSDNGGATTGIDDFGEVADCQLALADAWLGEVGNAAQGSPDETLLDPLRKCQGKLGKGTTRIVRTYLQERRRCQKVADFGAGTPSYSCGSADPRGRIAKTVTRFQEKTLASCNFSPMVLDKLDACDNDAPGLLACASNSASSRGAALIEAVYKLDGSTTITTTTTLPDDTTTTTTTAEPTTTTTIPVGTDCGDTFPTCNGDCPSGSTCVVNGGDCSCQVDGTGPCEPATIHRTILAKYGAVPSETSLSTGWSGSAHDVDIPDFSGESVDVTCDANCENCDVTLNISAGNPVSNCRCTSDSTISCGVINGADVDNCGSFDPTCRCYFGAPLALSSGGTPVCVINRIRTDYAGTMNLRSGEWHERIQLASVVYLGLDTLAPCPTCEGDPTPNDGVRGGTCTGGLGGGACDINGVHATFGATSWDCLPASAANISGAGLLIDLQPSTGVQSIPATRPCDTPNGEMCPCRVCSGNGNLGCFNDAQCAEAGAGTCTAGGGAGVVLNQCENFDCGADGQCTTGPVDTYCDDTVHPDGRGFVPCANNGDCNSGTCSVIDLRRCFPDPMQATGEAGTYSAVSNSLFCIAPTSNPAVNLAAGLPGPGELTLRFNTDVRCQSNKSVAYEFPSGANCTETTPTTTTTLISLPPCEDSDAPVCGGVCGIGQVCQDQGGTCGCTGLPLPSCDDATAPSCGGICPELGEYCTQIAGECSCQPLTLPQCTDAEAPTCGGVCPTGELCTDVGGACECGAPGVPTCGSAISPTCAGLCDPGQVCIDQGGSCGCLQLPVPTCAESAAPNCTGTCALGSLCQANGNACQCTTIPLP